MRQITVGSKMHISEKGLASRMQEELSHLNSKKTNKSLGKKKGP
jgi:hypothetical protein